jgi:guanosine-3',5'-bis(diphosphate) 3'-pyrophosphohydrolase
LTKEFEMSELLAGDITLVLRAASFAAHKHRDQRRKDHGASPYINHPLSLASILAEAGAVTDAATLCAALLHDTIEDTQTTEPYVPIIPETLFTSI